MSTELISRLAPPSARPRQYGRRQHNPLRRYAGIALVLVLHLFFIWALMNGLANKVVQIAQKPIETRIIQPVTPPPPPPIPTVKLPPPKFTPPPRPRPFVPPPEVAVTAPSTPTITHQATPEPTSVVQPPAPVTPPAPAKPVSHAIGVVCPNSDDVRHSMGYPQEAQDNEITGDVMISFVVDPQGHVTDEKVEQSADPILDRAAFVAVKMFNCISQGQPVRVQVPFSFKLS
ncbi:energy transducer TonB [Paraburkholderia ginsengiterrae]|uniref:Protein TonB n=1 Tax=Paraburkholderia ginsengiterrae TaxID=1462993 RepID=A0A1A9NAA2_9BURK|nr:energy transducer TonB [Paraburkholderia ginsengiterrae]OAJ60038.1 energy transducer TonB [Paraburkholderia ginsengiterrae]OAJ63172.1 energy transducer TonB [Paraburkholderia ginsengiterrae]